MGFVFPVLVILVLVGLLAGLFSALGTLLGKSGQASKYELVPSVLTIAESVFARVLFSIEMPEYLILSKVRVADFVSVKKGLGDEGRKAFYRIAQKHVDFLIVAKSDFKPVLAIELDDSFHGNMDRKRRDEFVDAIYRQIGLPILHVPVRVGYNSVELAMQMEALVFQPKE